ncbi:VOC family protein [Subtercola lobariae]|uniref:Oxidoreductase n=1 Tax=Subtercola lobariae TaxID=1588641 RepID=A0A917BF89_9MICO|nr:VOC family protein [Subtercola lobariae]GGF40080.1 oxidoreductase [Subtercola lobariae]
MTGTGSISELGYVSLRARDLSAVARNATELLGLEEVENNGSKAVFAAQFGRREIVYTQGSEDGLDHVGLIASSSDQLAAIRDKVRFGGYTVISEHPFEDYIDEGFAFVGPEGFTWHVYTARHSYSMVKNGSFGPDRFGHVNIQAVDTIAMRDFLADVFGFKVSDRIGNDAAFFMRCNNDHHGIAVFKSTRPALHHHAWQTQSIVDLSKLGDRLARRGSRLAWGPVRHGAGDNIAVYYVEPTGAVIELYTDLERIFDPEREIRYWDEENLYWINQWDGQVPPGILDHGVPPVGR